MPVEACGAKPFLSSLEAEASASLVHKHDPEVGIDLDVLSVAARVGPAVGAEAVVERLGVSVADGQIRIVGEFLAVGAELGTRNADGSKGFGIGLGAVLTGVEATLHLGHDNSVTLGTSAGVGAHVSVGVRDADHDGKPELCARVTEFVTIAGCIELPF
jgi:hypothetical protein